MHVMMFYYSVYTSQVISMPCQHTFVNIPGYHCGSPVNPFLIIWREKKFKNRKQLRVIWQLECFNQPERRGPQPATQTLPPSLPWIPCKTLPSCVANGWKQLNGVKKPKWTIKQNSIVIIEASTTLLLIERSFISR